MIKNSNKDRYQLKKNTSPRKYSFRRRVNSERTEKGQNSI
jgi:hypothetical protein